MTSGGGAAPIGTLLHIADKDEHHALGHPTNLRIQDSSISHSSSILDTKLLLRRCIFSATNGAPLFPSSFRNHSSYQRMSAPAKAKRRDRETSRVLCITTDIGSSHHSLKYICKQQLTPPIQKPADGPPTEDPTSPFFRQAS